MGEGIWKPVFQSEVFQDTPRLVIGDARTPATNKNNNISNSPDYHNGQEHVGENEREVDGCHCHNSESFVSVDGTLQVPCTLERREVHHKC